MGFIIRSIFWLSLVLLIIPFGGTGGEGQEDVVSPVEALLAARGAIQDVTGMCERKPEVCETGKAALHTIGVRAREGARIAYEALDSRYGDGATGQATEVAASDPVADIIATGSVAESR
jgi:hypothetical protein